MYSIWVFMVGSISVFLLTVCMGVNIMINNDKKVKLKPQLKEIQNQSPKTLKEALEEIDRSLCPCTNI